MGSLTNIFLTKEDIMFEDFEKFADDMAKKMARAIDSELLWNISCDEVMAEATKMNGGKNIYDRRTRGGKYLAAKKKEFMLVV